MQHTHVKRNWPAFRRSGILCLLLLTALPVGVGLQARRPFSPAAAEAQTVRKKSDAGGTKTTKGDTKSRRPAAAQSSGPADYASKNFLVHTDLPPEDAQDLLKRLETMLALISKYWGRPPSGIIECYVVKDLRNWPDGVLSPEGLRSIQANAGVTASQASFRGNVLVFAKATVYAVADRGTPQHEAVHAYCAQTFGTTGPVWYSEGMAEMGQYWKDGDPSVNAHEIVIDYLRRTDPKSLNEIVNGEEQTGDSWQNYAWRWALCHLLANNTNYAPRFRPLGLGLLMRQDVSFEKVYGDMAQEISFEYLLFLKHLEQGYRADLCSWDWKAKFRKMNSAAPITATVNAAQGWQPSRARLTADEEYEYSVSGTWSTGDDPVDADGGAEGQGKLVGVLLHNYELSEPFELGTYGSFRAPAEGDLYLRCQDKWNEIADNKGKLTVKLKLKSKGNPLAPPHAEGGRCRRGKRGEHQGRRGLMNGPVLRTEQTTHRMTSLIWPGSDGNDVDESERPESGGAPAPEPANLFQQEVQHSQVSARVPEHIGAGVFSTGAIVMQGAHEFVLDFLQNVSLPRRIVARVVLPITVVPLFIEALRDNLQKYERQFGPLPRRPVSPAAPAPGTPANPPPAPTPVSEIYEQLKLPDQLLSGTFANTVMIVHTPAEFCFDFITNFYPRSAVSCRVILSAPHVPEIFQSLANGFEQFCKRQEAQRRAADPPRD